MLRVSNKDNEPEKIQAAYIYHPESSALERKVVEIVAHELALFGLHRNDYHEIRNDIEFAREIRQARKRSLAFAIKAVMLGLLTVLGSLITAGFYTILSRSQP